MLHVATLHIMTKDVKDAKNFPIKNALGNGLYSTALLIFLLMFSKPTESENQHHGVSFSAAVSLVLYKLNGVDGNCPGRREPSQEEERSHYLKAKCHWKHYKQIQDAHKHENIPSPSIHLDFHKLRAFSGTGARLIKNPA